MVPSVIVDWSSLKFAIEQMSEKIVSNRMLVVPFSLVVNC